eukprot:gene26826-32413_t
MVANVFLRKVAKLMNPHLSKVIGSTRPPAIDWRLDPLPRPPVLPFDASAPLVAVQKAEMMDLRRPYRILCLDGGGIRGVLTTVLMKRIVMHHPKLLDEVDFICGTSAGGLLSLLLSAGYQPAECHDIYKFAAPHIFGHNPWRVINPLRAKYSDKAKQELMQHYFGERCIGHLKKTCAVVAFRLDGRKSSTHSFFNKEGWRPSVFSNMPRAEGLVEPDLDLKVWDAAMRTSAAPTFFPVFNGYTDGGIVANNPSIVAVSKAMAHYSHVNPKRIALLSIGAGNFPRHTNIFSNVSSSKIPLVIDGQASDDAGPLKHADWGIRQWVPFLLDLLLDGDSITTEMVMHYLLAGTKMYHRVDPMLPRQIALDDVTAMQELEDFAWSVDLTSTLKFVDSNFSYDEKQFDNEVHNSLDNATPYHDAWHNSVQVQNKLDINQ